MYAAPFYCYLVCIVVIFESQSMTYLGVSAGIVRDTSGNLLAEIDAASAMRIGPTLVNFQVNMNTGELRLLFSEPVSSNFSGIGFTFYTFPSTRSGELALTTSSNFTSIGTDVDSALYSLYLTLNDVNAMKLLGIGLTQATTYLTMIDAITLSSSLNSLVQNMLVRGVNIHNPLRVYSLISDNVSPVCYSFGLDLNIGRMYVFCSEPMDSTFIRMPSITLFASNGGSSIDLSTPQSISRINTTSLSFQLQLSDLNYIKVAQLSHPFDRMVLADDSLRDLSRNGVIGHDITNPIELSYIILDSTPPNIIYFSINYATNLISIQFDEIINISSISITNVQLLSSSNISTAIVFNLTYFSYIEPSTSDTVTINMDLYRYDAITLSENLYIGHDVNSIFLHIDKVADIAGNIDTRGNIIPCTSLIPDTSTSPSLESFDFYPYGSLSGIVTITVYFSRVIDVAVFDCSDFILQSDAINPIESMHLLPSSCTLLSTSNSREISFSLSTGLLSSFTFLGSSQSRTFIRMASIVKSKGTSGNSIFGSSSIAIPPGPTIVKFLLDMNKQEGIVLFSKIVVRNSFQYTSLGFYSDVTSSYFYLAGGGSGLNAFAPSSPGVDSLGIISFSSSDVTTMKLSRIAENKIYVLAKSTLVTDTLGQTHKEFNLDNKLPVTRLNKDTMPPILLSVDLDMGIESLLFTFDEPIDPDDIDLTRFTIQAGPTEVYDAYTLTGGNIVTFKGTMALRLLEIDAARIKLNTNLAYSRNSSYVSILFNAFTDMAGNYFQSIPYTNALEVSTYKNDTVPPTLYRFDMDMQIGTILLYFNEPIMLSTFNITRLFIQSRLRRSDGVSWKNTFNYLFICMYLI